MVDVGIKADMKTQAKAAGQSLTDYLLQKMQNVVNGSYEPVRLRASLRPATNKGVEIYAPLSLLAKIEDQMKLFGLTFTDFLLGAWTRRLEAEETAKPHTSSTTTQKGTDHAGTHQHRTRSPHDRPSVLHLIVEATVEAESHGYQMGQAAGHDATKHGYEVGYKDGQAIGYRIHQEETEDVWVAVEPTNDALRHQHQDWIAAGPPEHPAAPDLRPTIYASRADRHKQVIAPGAGA